MGESFSRQYVDYILPAARTLGVSAVGRGSWDLEPPGSSSPSVSNIVRRDDAREVPPTRRIYSAIRRGADPERLFKTRVSNGILGSFWITPTGDTTLNAVAVHRIVDGKVTTTSTVLVPDALVGR